MHYDICKTFYIGTANYYTHIIILSQHILTYHCGQYAMQHVPFYGSGIHV